jgi:hypothetical protein
MLPHMVEREPILGILPNGYLDQLHGASGPLDFLLLLSFDVQQLAEFIDEYAGRPTEEWIELHQEDEPGAPRQAICAEAARSVHQYLVDYERSAKASLSSLYFHGKDVWATPEVRPVVLEILGLLEMLSVEATKAKDEFLYAIRYCWFDSAEDAEKHGGEWARKRWTQSASPTDYKEALACAEDFSLWLEESAIGRRFDELAYRLVGYCKLHGLTSHGIEAMERRRVERLLDQDVVKCIVRTLGRDKKTRAEIVAASGYADGGHVAGALVHLKREKLLNHERPYYWIRPELYDVAGV